MLNACPARIGRFRGPDARALTAATPRAPGHARCDDRV